jgi:hypothetical protein
MFYNYDCSWVEVRVRVRVRVRVSGRVRAAIRSDLLTLSNTRDG